MVAPQPVVPPAPMAMPVAPPEVAALAKTLAGTWKCKGLMFMPNGASMPMNSTIKTKVELDGFWLRTSYAQTGVKKDAFKFESLATYEASSKTWHRVQTDNMGSQEVGTSTGTLDGKTVWNVTSRNLMGTSMGRHYEGMEVAMTANGKVGNEYKMWGEYSMDKGKTWAKAYESVCKK